MKYKYDYNELLEKINKIVIKLEGDEVATYYGDREVSRKRVSSKYEIFDFRPFVIKCVNEISEKYEISEYDLDLRGGKQEIRLYSNKIDVKGEEFTKTFYLLNSSDKSRALSLTYGLSHPYFNFVSSNGAIYKKHYKGITEYVEERVDLKDEIFDQIIESLSNLIGKHIMMSNAQRVITESEFLSESKVSYKQKFKSFCIQLGRSYRNQIDREFWSTLWWGDFDYNQRKEKDFQLDAFTAFKAYLQVFKNRDAMEIKRESDRIIKLTTEEIRTDLIGDLLNEV